MYGACARGCCSVSRRRHAERVRDRENEGRRRCGCSALSFAPVGLIEKVLRAPGIPTAGEEKESREVSSHSVFLSVVA